MEVGKREIRYTVTTRNDSCIKMGSDESDFNVSLIVRDTVHDGVYKPQYSKRKANRSKIEPRSFCLPAFYAKPNWLCTTQL